MQYPPANHEISLAAAIDLTGRFQADPPAGFAISETFTGAAVEKLLSTSGACYLRAYNGRKESGEACLVLVAVDAEGEDILPVAEAAATADGPVIIEDGFRCPQYCPANSPLSGS